MVVFGQGCCILEKWLYSGKSGSIQTKVVVIGQSCRIRAKWLFLAEVFVLGQNGFIRAKVLVFGQGGCIRLKWFYSGKVVVFGICGCFQAKFVVVGHIGSIRESVVVFGQNWFSSEKSGCIWARCLYYVNVVVFDQKLLYSGKVALFGFYSGKKGSIRAKVVLFGQKWLLSGKSCCI